MDQINLVTDRWYCIINSSDASKLDLIFQYYNMSTISDNSLLKEKKKSIVYNGYSFLSILSPSSFSGSFKENFKEIPVSYIINYSGIKEENENENK